jgi:hypothetical protein
MASFFWTTNFPFLRQLKERREVSRTFWNIFMTKVKENNNGIIFLDHKNFPFLRQLKERPRAEGTNLFSIWNIPQFIYFYFIFRKHKGRPDWTSHWHPQVKLIGRGPKTRSFTSFTPLGLNPGSLNGL